MRLRLGVFVGLLTVLALVGGGGAAWATDSGSSGDGPGFSRSSESGGPTLVSVAESGDAPFTEEQAEKFAKCMRANGIPDFETPTVTPPSGDEPGRVTSVLPKNVDPETAKKATEKCGAPGPGKVKLSASELKKLKRYAKCMRENGIEDFPTPKADGALMLPEGTDPDSSEFQAAEKACQKYAPAHRVEKHVQSGDGEETLHAGAPAPVA